MGPPEARRPVRHRRSLTPKLNWKGVLARKDDVITRHTKGLDFLMKKNKINAIKGYGRLTGPAKDGVHYRRSED